MQAVLFNGPYELEFTNVKQPVPGKGELLIRVGACGVCGTDFHIFAGEAPAKAPVIIGHEYVGEVVDAGADVNGFKQGDRVAVDPNIYCGYCNYCRSGRINLCTNLRALGVTLNGGFSQLSLIPVSQAYKIPDSLSFEHAAFSEPLSCCVHGINQADIKLNETVAVVGAGTIGLLILQLTKLKGAGKVIALEPMPEKRKMALILGADYAIDPADDSLSEMIAGIAPEGIDLVIECAGNEKAAELSLNIVKKGGRLVIFGLAGPNAVLNLPIQSFFHKELSIKSSLLNPYTFQTAVDLLASSKIKVDSFVIGKMNLYGSEMLDVFQGKKNKDVTKYMVIPEN